MTLDFFAGCLGGCAGVMVGHPFDTVKVRIQTQDFRNPQYRGAIDCFAKILKAESVSGLYKGMSSPMAGVAVVNAIVFGVYGNFQRHLSHPEALSSHFMAGAAAGFVQSFVCCPMELIKTRLQVQRHSGYSGPLHCLVQVLKTQGVRGIFRGLGTTICREVPGFGTYFSAYELMTRSSGDAPISTAHMLLAGGFSGTLSWVLTYPIDVVKSRLQADGTNGAYKYSGFIDCFRKSVQSEGYGVMTRGLTSTILRAFPTNAATFTVVTWVIRWANNHHIDDSEGYVIPDIINPEPLPVNGNCGFRVKTFGMKDREFKYEYLNNIFNWRKVVLNSFSGSDMFTNFHLVPKSSQIYSLQNEKDASQTPSIEIIFCNDTQSSEVPEEDAAGEEDSRIEPTLLLEKEENTYQHKNDYYNSSVR